MTSEIQSSRFFLNILIFLLFTHTHTSFYTLIGAYQFGLFLTPVQKYLLKRIRDFVYLYLFITCMITFAFCANLFKQKKQLKNKHILKNENFHVLSSLFFTWILVVTEEIFIHFTRSEELHLRVEEKSAFFKETRRVNWKP